MESTVRPTRFKTNWKTNLTFPRREKSFSPLSLRVAKSWIASLDSFEGVDSAYRLSLECHPPPPPPPRSNLVSNISRYLRAMYFDTFRRLVIDKFGRVYTCTPNFGRASTCPQKTSTRPRCGEQTLICSPSNAIEPRQSLTGYGSLSCRS